MTEERIKELGIILKKIELGITYEITVNNKKYFTEEEAFHLKTIFGQIIRRHTEYGKQQISNGG